MRVKNEVLKERVEKERESESREEVRVQKECE